MKSHLNAEEFVAALDGNLSKARLVHLEACESCRAEVSQMSTLVAEIANTPTPEPSPLFWTHFSARVSAANAAVPAPGRWGRWTGLWRPVGAVAALAGALALVIVLRPALVLKDSNAVAVVSESGSDTVVPEADSTWSLVMGLASEIDAKDLRQAVVPTSGTADAVIEELTAAQREALARLLQAEMGGSE